MLTLTTVGGLKQSLKCVMRWGLHHQCPGYAVVSVTEQAYQHLIPLNTLEELSHFHLDHLLSELDKQFSSHKKKNAFQGQYFKPSRHNSIYIWRHNYSIKASCNTFCGTINPERRCE